jgi:O-antigen ligase
MPAFLPRIFQNPAAVAAFAFPMIVLVGNKLLTAAVIGLAVTALIWARPVNWRRATAFLVMLGLIAVLGALSAIWSTAPAVSLERAGRFAALGFCGVIVCLAAMRLDPAKRADVAAGLLVGLTVAAALSFAGLVWQAFVGPTILSALNHKPFATVAAVLLFPAAGVLIVKGRPWTAVVGSLALVVLFATADSMAAVIAAAAGGGAFLLVYFGQRRVAGVVSAAILLGAVIVPAAVAWTDLPSRILEQDIQLRHSLTHRIAVWDFVGNRIMERPFTGWGLGTARKIPGAGVNPLERPAYHDMLMSSGISSKTVLQTLPLHPHNAVLHMTLDLGIPGLVLYLAFGRLCFRRVIRALPDRLARAAGIATVTAAIAVGQVSFSVWQSWWIAAQFMAAAILLALFRSET